MNKNVRKVFSLAILPLFLFTILFTDNAFAQNVNNKIEQKPQIISIEGPSEVSIYGTSILPKHINAARNSPDGYGLANCDVSELILGTPFNIYNYNNDQITNTEIYYFPVIHKGTIKATLAVTKDKKGELTSTFSKGFASNLNDILQSNKGKKFRIISVDNEVRAVSNDSALLLAEDPSKEIKASANLLKVFDNSIDNMNELSEKNVKEKRYKETIIDPYYVKSIPSNTNNLYPSGGPTSSKYLNVPFVWQDVFNWCWAATCASIINYKTGKELAVEDVVSYIYGPSLPDKGGSYFEEIKAYKNWGISSYYDGKNMTWSKAVSELDSGTPIDSGWFTMYRAHGHAMTVRGYEYYSDTEDKVYLLIDPNMGYVSITGRDYSGDCVYILNGSNFYWTESIRF